MQKRILCVYVYYEKDETYVENFRYFIKHGINNYSDYIIVINGNKCSVKIPERNNVVSYYRDNKGYDFGAYEFAINNVNIYNYDYFIFLNTSVRGPFNRIIVPWQERFVSLIKKDTKLVGTTINVCTIRFPLLEKLGMKAQVYSHVQSQFFCMDKECMLFLKDKIFVPLDPKLTFNQVIQLREVAMSQYVLKNNWNISCLLPKYRGLDYRLVNKDPNPTSLNGDPSFAGRYFGNTYDAYDVVFIKTNRDLIIPDTSSYWFAYLIIILFLVFLVSLAYITHL